MKKFLLSIVFLILTTALIVANLKPLNGLTTIQIAHKLPVLLMPADFTLLIRPVIFIFLAYWIYKFDASETRTTIRSTLFTIACLANTVWFPLWHFGFFGWACLSTLVALFSLYALYRTYPKKQNLFSRRIPISLYFSWTLLDFVINANYLLVLDEWNRFGISTVLWTILNLTILTAVALHFSYHHSERMMSYVFIWVFLGIIVNIGLEELFVSLATLFLMAILVLGIMMFSPSQSSKKIKETSLQQN